MDLSQARCSTVGFGSGTLTESSTMHEHRYEGAESGDEIVVGFEDDEEPFDRKTMGNPNDGRTEDFTYVGEVDESEDESEEVEAEGEDPTAVGEDGETEPFTITDAPTSVRQLDLDWGEIQKLNAEFETGETDKEGILDALDEIDIVEIEEALTEIRSEDTEETED